jgi:hypothetical protein
MKAPTGPGEPGQELVPPESARISTGTVAPGQLGKRQPDRGDVVGGGIRLGVPRPQHDDQRLTRVPGVCSASNADARKRTATDQLASACLLTPKAQTDPDGSNHGCLSFDQLDALNRATHPGVRISGIADSQDCTILDLRRPADRLRADTCSTARPERIALDP